jgi:hypothetical protein
MAYMIPPYVKENISSNAEKKMFSLIKEDNKLKNSYCIHSLGLSEHKKQAEGEIDFVLVTKKGIFALEVKGGRVRRENGVWEFIDRFGNINKKVKGPFQQVKDGLYSLRKSLLKKFGDEIHNILFGYGVVFPDINFEIDSPEWNNNIIYDQKDRFKPFSYYLNRLNDYWSTQFRNKRNISDHKIKEYINYLRGDFELIKKYNFDDNYINEEIINLTNEQYSALDRMNFNDKVLFSGTAGTGKTLLALEETKRKALNDQNIILLCFNKILAGRFKKATSNFSKSKNIDSNSIHKFMHKIIEKAGLVSLLVKKKNNVNENKLFEEIYPEIFLQAIKIIDFVPYDYVIIDEGQDILNYNYFVVVDYLIKGGLENGKWSIFYDPNRQSGLYNEYSKELIDDLKRFGAAEYRLDINCRNTKQIVNQTGILTNFQVEKSNIDGEKVKIFWYSNESELLNQLDDLINKLINQNVKEKYITILFANKIKRYRKFFNQKPNKYIEINYDNVGELPPNKISFSSVQSYKGLENEIIIYIGVNKINGRWIEVVNYIALTRAKEMLYIFLNNDLKNEYRNKFKKYLGGILYE